MAETNSSLGFNSKLKIVIVPHDKHYDTPTKDTHILVFREDENIIEVNGHKYKATSSADLTAITTALKNTGYLTTGSDGVLTAKDPGTVAALLGEKISTDASGDKKTVSAWIDDILGQISGINTDISNLQNVTKTDSSSTFVVRKSGTDETDFATTTAIQTAITDAKTAAITAAEAYASDEDTQVKKDLIGDGKDSAAADSTPLKPGTGNTWAQSEAKQKNLSHLKDLILNLQGQLNTLTKTDLTKVNDAIKAIEQELINGGGNNLTTIIDGLKVFLGSGLNTGGATHTVGGTSSNYTLQQIITALEGQITAVQSKHSVVTDGVEGDATASDTNYAVVTSSTTDGKTTYTVKTTKALDYALSNAKTAVTGGTGAASSTNYIAVTKSTNGHDSYAVSTTTDLDLAISSAQSNAEATALTYANSVITWTVIS